MVRQVDSRTGMKDGLRDRQVDSRTGMKDGLRDRKQKRADGQEVKMELTISP